MFERAWRWLKLQKEGIGIGALAGIAAYLLYSHTGAPLFAVQSPSLLDNAIEVATKWKVLFALILIGSTAGGLADSWIKPNK